MPEAIISLIKGDKTEINTDYRDALPVNMYAVSRDILGAQGYMLCYPGLSTFATGKVKETVVPFPIVLSIQMVPPRCSIIDLDIANPNPVPSV